MYETHEHMSCLTDLIVQWSRIYSDLISFWCIQQCLGGGFCGIVGESWILVG